MFKEIFNIIKFTFIIFFSLLSSAISELSMSWALFEMFIDYLDILLDKVPFQVSCLFIY